MNAATTTFRSILEKPLNQLTEDDISQLTREDCRKYLKEKGMRRPSWNKSQAIQQVISLKALLEPNDDSGAGALRRIVVSPRTTTAPRSAASNSADPCKEASGDVQVSLSADEPVLPNQRPIQVYRPAQADSKAISPRNLCTTVASVKQMTIFYSGNVNVYDGVPPDKARAIMHLVARPHHLPLENQFGGTAAVRSLRCQFQTAGNTDGLFPHSATISQPMQTEKSGKYTQQYWEKGNSTRDPEGQASRKFLLQKYLEKRKDRGRLKIKKNIGSSSHTPNGNSSRSGTSSPPQPGLLQKADYQPKIHCLPIGLNEKDIQESRT